MDANAQPAMPQALTQGPEPFSKKWRDACGFTPLWRYLNLIFVLLGRKPGTWIFLAFILVVPMVVGAAAGASASADLYTSFMLVEWYLIICFVTIKAINLFNDPQAQGYEVLIVAKPIERWQIVSGKMTALFCLALGSAALAAAGSAVGVAVFQAMLSAHNLVQSLVTKLLGAPDLGYGYVGFVFGAALMISLLFGSIAAMVALKCSAKMTQAIPPLIFLVLYLISIGITFITLSRSSSSAVNFLNAVVANPRLKELDFQISLAADGVPTLSISAPSGLSADDLQWLKQTWSDNAISGAWWPAVKWLDVVVALFSQNQTATYDSLSGISSATAAMSNPDFAYAANFSAGANPVVTIQRGTEVSPTWAVILLWCFISLFFVWLCGHMYMKRDFN